MEAEHVEVGHVVGDGDESLLQIFGVAEVDEFSAGSCVMDSAVLVRRLPRAARYAMVAKRSGGASRLMQSSTCLL